MRDFLMKAVLVLTLLSGCTFGGDEKTMIFPTLDLAAPDPVAMAGYQAFADTNTGDVGGARPVIRLRSRPLVRQPVDSGLYTGIRSVFSRGGDHTVSCTGLYVART